jgi:hypothetical protein
MQMDLTLTWPEKPTCHSIDPVFVIADHMEWRPPARGEPFRRCSYCGSMHPEDVLRVLSIEGTKLGGSDWKYGWPHKFYIDILDNKPIQEDGEQAVVEAIDKKLISPAKFYGKWYNEHLTDAGYSKDAFEALTKALHEHSGILFKLDGDKLAYAAPSRGYQR